MARPALAIRLIGDKDRAGRDQGDSYPIGNGRALREDEQCEVGGQVKAELIKRPDLARTPRAKRQARLRAFQRLALALLVAAQQQRPLGRIEHVSSDFLELIGRGFAGAAILGEFIAHLLTFA